MSCNAHVLCTSAVATCYGEGSTSNNMILLLAFLLPLEEILQSVTESQTSLSLFLL